jgi:hypothetical protein
MVSPKPFFDQYILCDYTGEVKKYQGTVGKLLLTKTATILGVEKLHYQPTKFNPPPNPTNQPSPCLPAPAPPATARATAPAATADPAPTKSPPMYSRL